MRGGVDVWLFSFRTLQQEEVQLVTLGRQLEGRTDALHGDVTALFEITDAGFVATSGKAHHSMARPTGHAADEAVGVTLAPGLVLRE